MLTCSVPKREGKGVYPGLKLGCRVFPKGKARSIRGELLALPPFENWALLAQFSPVRRRV